MEAFGIVDGEAGGDIKGETDAEGEADGSTDGVGVADGVAISALGVEMIVSGMTSGIADWVASGIASGGIVSVEFELVKIVSGSRRGSSGVVAGVSAELVASIGGESWACAMGGAGSMEIHG